MYSFDSDTALTQVGDGRWSVDLKQAWCVGSIPNGGYLAALTASALGASLPQADPVSSTTHYLRPCMVGSAQLRVEVLKLGRGHSTALATLSQGGKDRLVTLATYGDLAAASGENFHSAAPPELPPVEACWGFEDTDQWVPEIARRFEFRYGPEARAAFAAESEKAELAGWIRFEDGRDADTRSLLTFADAFPPPIRAVMPVGWVPTIELTVQIKGRPAPGWLRARFTTRWCEDGYLEEDGELWDSRDKLVAISRQLARVTQDMP
jgi:acyl-CoA thioesterase